MSDEGGGISFGLSEEQVLVRSSIGDFVRERLGPEVARREREGEFPSEVLVEAAGLGLCGISVPQEWDGAGMDHVTYALLIEEVAAVDPAFAVTLSVTNSVCAFPILNWGNDDQRDRFLRRLARGEVIGGFALTEPHAGSDASNLKTTAVRDGDSYVLNGTKAWVTNAGIGEVFVVMACTDPDAKRGRNTAFIVEASNPGFHVDRFEEKMGIHSSRTATIVLEDCRVPPADRLGDEGQGMEVALGSLDGARNGIGAQAVGIGRAALAEAVLYAREREAFGRPIKDFQAIQWLVADSHVELEAARALVWRAARARDMGLPYGNLSAMAKYYASEAANRICERAVQIHGGYGFSAEYTVERLYRDARVTTIYEGTSQIQKMVIFRQLLRECKTAGLAAAAGADS